MELNGNDIFYTKIHSYKSKAKNPKPESLVKYLDIAIAEFAPKLPLNILEPILIYTWLCKYEYITKELKIREQFNFNAIKYPYYKEYCYRFICLAFLEGGIIARLKETTTHTVYRAQVKDSFNLWKKPKIVNSRVLIFS